MPRTDRRLFLADEYYRVNKNPPFSERFGHKFRSWWARAQPNVEPSVAAFSPVRTRSSASWPRSDARQIGMNRASVGTPDRCWKNAANPWLGTGPRSRMARRIIGGTESASHKMTLA